MSEFGAVVPRRRDGAEPLHDAGEPLGFALVDFWQWSSSDLLDNTLRGGLAEFIVARAIGDLSPVRPAWASYDLSTPGGIKVEVKSAAYVQSWSQRGPSVISFRVGKRLGWDPETGLYAAVPRRHADVYVFALLAEQDQAVIDPLNVAQWKFYVLPTSVLEGRKRSQHSITLASLQGLTRVVAWEALGDAVRAAQGQHVEAVEHP